jgi:nicotinamide-nucleotide amidase
VSVLSGTKGIEVQLFVEGETDSEVTRRLSRVERTMRERLGQDLYGVDGDTLPAVTGRLLQKCGKTLATAESCTAGLLAGAVTGVPGSTAWFRGGVVVYADALKVSLAGVRGDSLNKHGAVSAEVAGELAEGVRCRCGADIGIGITGIAGPSGGSPEKPVGLVHVAISDMGELVHRRLMLPGDRAQVRDRTVTAALDRLRRHLMGGTGG